MTDLDFDHEDRGRLVRAAEVWLTKAEREAVKSRAESQGVTVRAVLRAATRRALESPPDPLALEAEQEVTSRRKVGAAKTNSKR